jgi:predicted RNase H-like nuclease (RuvC/YqgF family)
MRATVRLDESLTSHVETLRDDPETSDAEAVRTAIRRSKRVEELETELEHKQARIDELESELAETRSRLEVSNEIVEYVEEEKTAQERWRQAGLLRKAKWSVFGMDESDDD